MLTSKRGYQPLQFEDAPRLRSPRRSWKPRTSRACFLMTFGVVFLIIIISSWYFLYDQKLGAPRRLPADQYQLPANPRIVGLVFYGRRSRVSILDCYLKRNLVENGGSLDEVKFLVRTDNIEDLRYLDELVETSASYSRVDLTQSGQAASKVNYGRVWDVAVKGVLYVKVDDDVLYIDNATIPTLIASKMKHPEHLVISANVVNNPALAWVHYHLGAILPYLPEQPSSPNAGQDLLRHDSSSSPWRASELPRWTGPPGFTLARHPSAPSKTHRWLPLGPEYNLDGTPITMTDWKDHRASWGNWAVVAQEHYSFLEHLEKEQLSKYHFDHWDYHYERLSINLIVVWGDDIVENRPVPSDDEKWLTVDLPKKTGRHVVVEGGAVASHYAFRGQTGLESTDVLERYAAYAQEMVCIR